MKAPAEPYVALDDSCSLFAHFRRMPLAEQDEVANKGRMDLLGAWAEMAGTY